MSTPKPNTSSYALRVQVRLWSATGMLQSCRTALKSSTVTWTCHSQMTKWRPSLTQHLIFKTALLWSLSHLVRTAVVTVTWLSSLTPFSASYHESWNMNMELEHGFAGSISIIQPPQTSLSRQSGKRGHATSFGVRSRDSASPKHQDVMLSGCQYQEQAVLQVVIWIGHFCHLLPMSTQAGRDLFSTVVAPAAQEMLRWTA